MYILKKITQKELFKVFSLNSISVLVKFIVGFISGKVMAAYIGPHGMGIVGNWRTFFTTLENVATLGSSNGIIKYVSEYKTDTEKLKKFVATTTITLFFWSICISSVLFVFSGTISHYLCNSLDYEPIVKYTSLVLPWYIASFVFMTILNGLQKFRLLILLNIVSNILVLLLSVWIIMHYKTSGAMFSISVVPAIMVCITLFFVWKNLNISLQNFQKIYVLRLLEFLAMSLASMLLLPLVQLYLRTYLVQQQSFEVAGYYEAISRISNYYMLFITTIISVYFFPKLATSTSNNETKTIFQDYFKTIIPVFFVGLVVLYFCRDFVINLLFTASFKPVSNLFLWQEIGDFFKAMSLILGFQFFAKKLTFPFIILEIVSITILLLLSVLFINIYGVKGMVIGYAVHYIIYFLLLIIYFKNIIFKK
ncbi:PST family polysaccharide transporter [Flavobacterium croceum DSM 17960]|uniref:PST family polysaccharide transporter n=1 Tax=Flavobacterium croceum DSM 17960 TaxID=1121886 RepID=A0A2S4N5W8_9FLAO|nr:O-antigen translocase [Flavobacterium croceum]POS01109.1 PST family polysaccharide transporter [Flavobacterium croceum DSM 17960]